MDRARNVLLILCDQLRADFLGCYGGPRYTPNIDALASEGVLFTRAYCSAPVCTSSRASLLTGKHHPLTCSNNIPNDVPTIAQLLSESGKHTACIGKMHMWPIRGPFGFNRICLSEDFPFHTFHDDYHREIAEHGYYDTAHGLDVFDILPAVSTVPEDKTVTHWNGRKVVEFLRSRNNNATPFYAVASFVKPHPPYDPVKRFLDMIRPEDVPPPRVARDANEYPESCRLYGKVYGDTQVEKLDVSQSIRRHYLALVAQIDEQIGLIVDTLKEEGLYDRTLIVFSSDHGDLLGDHHLYMKFFGYEASARIPLIVRGPGVPVGAVSYAPVSNVDYVPTILEYCSQRIPQSCDGTSFLPLLEGRNVARKGILVAMTVDNGYCWVTDKHKYILYQNGEEELFDLIADPGESCDLSSARKTLAGEMRTDLIGELIRLDARRVGTRPLVVDNQPRLDGDRYPSIEWLAERFMQHRMAPYLEGQKRRAQK